MSHSIVSTPWQADFLVLPQAPLCYWLRPRFFELLSGRRLGDVADAVTGLQTSDDDGFVRFVWEVRPEEWVWPLRERRWVPFEKGGGYGKWFGQHWWAVDWENDGARIKVFPASVVRNEQHYLKKAGMVDGGAYHLAALPGAVDDAWSSQKLGHQQQNGYLRTGSR